jgi:uncharacterized protein (TIGR03086 family)
VAILIADTRVQEASMDKETFVSAVASSRPVVASLTPAQMLDPTPCSSWRVKDLVNHMIDAPTFAAVVMETGSFENMSPESVDHAAGDYLTAYDSATSRAAAAFEVKGALDKIVKLPFGEMPGSVFLSIAAGDVFAHGWDLAKATGIKAVLDEKLAGEILEAVRPMLADEMRGPDGKAPFGPLVVVADSAPASDRLAGFLGRQP